MASARAGRRELRAEFGMERREKSSPIHSPFVSATDTVSLANYRISAEAADAGGGEHYKRLVAYVE